VVGLTIAWLIKQVQDQKREKEARKQIQRPLGQIKPSESVDKSAAPKEIILSDRRLDTTHRMEQSLPTSESQAPSQANVQHPSLVTLVSFYTAVPTPSPTPASSVLRKPPTIWLPRGIFISCALVNTVESSHIDTPVVGEVLHDVYQKNNGKSHLIIPAGTLVNCFAQPGAVRDRIEVKGTWSLTFPDGLEYELQGVACNREADPNTQQFGLEDGSAGLQGELIESDHWINAKIFLGTALAGAVQAAETSHNTIYGTQLDRTPPNVGLNATSAVIDRYVQRLLDGENGDGRFVRVRSGKEFYIYPVTIIEPQYRSVGASRQKEGGEEGTPNVSAGPSPTPSDQEKALKQALDVRKQLLEINQTENQQKNNANKAPHFHY